MRFLAAAMCLVLLAPMAVQATPEAHILHDADRATGYAQADSPLHFGFAAVDGGEPMRKRGGVFEIQSRGQTLYQFDHNAGYAYDAFDPVFVMLPRGPYHASVAVNLGGSAEVTAEFAGEAHALENAIPATLEVKHSLDAGTLHTTIAIRNGTQLVDHSDALVEIRRPDHWLIFRTHLHTHTEAMEFDYAFPAKGTFKLRVIGYNDFPTTKSVSFAPLLHEEDIIVDSVPAPPLLSLPAPQDPPIQDSGDLRLRLTQDPQGSTSPFSRFELGGYVYEVPTQAFKQHVDFESRIVDMQGRVLFASKTLHEYDGYYEVAFHWPHPGQYRFELKAERGTWTSSAQKTVNVLTVLPPDRSMEATSAGPIVVTVEGLNQVIAWSPATIAFHARTAAGTPAQHSEIDFQIRRPDGLTLLQNKVHTHVTGDFQFRVGLPEAGDYILVIDPVTIHGEPTPDYHYDSLTGGLVIPFVAGAKGLPPLPPVEEPLAANIPNVGSLTALALVGAMTVAFRRR